MKDKVAAKTRLQTTRHTLLKNQIKARLKQIEIQIRQVDAAIAERLLWTRRYRTNSLS